MTTTPPTPATVEPGQIWRDNDQRTKHPEFTVLAVWHPSGDVKYVPNLGTAWGGKVHHAVAVGTRAPGSVRPLAFAVVQREDDRLVRVRVDRLLNGTNTQRGYTYLGMSR